MQDAGQQSAALHPRMSYSPEKSLVMMLSRTTLVAIIIVLAILAAGSLGAFLYQNSKTGTVEIRLDKNGLRIEGN